MEIDTAFLVTGLITIGIALSRGLEMLIKFVVSKNGKNKNLEGIPTKDDLNHQDLVNKFNAVFRKLEKLIEDCQKLQNINVLKENDIQMLKDLHTMLNRTDNDGVPLCYVPRSWEHLMNKIVDQLQISTQTSQQQTMLLNSIWEKLREFEKHGK